MNDDYHLSASFPVAPIGTRGLRNFPDSTSLVGTERRWCRWRTKMTIMLESSSQVFNPISRDIRLHLSFESKPLNLLESSLQIFNLHISLEVTAISTIIFSKIIPFIIINVIILSVESASFLMDKFLLCSYYSSVTVVAGGSTCFKFTISSYISLRVVCSF